MFLKIQNCFIQIGFFVLANLIDLQKLIILVRVWISLISHTHMVQKPTSILNAEYLHIEIRQTHTKSSKWVLMILQYSL